MDSLHGINNHGDSFYKDSNPRSYETYAHRSNWTHHNLQVFTHIIILHALQWTGNAQWMSDTCSLHNYILILDKYMKLISLFLILVNWSLYYIGTSVYCFGSWDRWFSGYVLTKYYHIMTYFVLFVVQTLDYVSFNEVKLLCFCPSLVLASGHTTYTCTKNIFLVSVISGCA